MCVCVCVCVCEQDNCTQFKYYIVYAYSLWLKEDGDIFRNVPLNADRGYGYGIMPMTMCWWVAATVLVRGLCSVDWQSSAAGVSLLSLSYFDADITVL